MNFDAFEGEQKKVLINMAEELKKAKEAKENKDEDILGFDDSPVVKKDKAHLAKFTKIWRSNGRVDGSDAQVTIEQLLDKDIAVRKHMRDNFSTDLPLLIPRTLSNFVKEAVEPALVLTPLMTRINYSAGTRVSFPSFGGLSNAAADLAEGEEYPSGSMELGGQTECIIGKSGIACQVTEEQKRYSQFDIISMNLNACGRSLARLKERKVSKLITDNGTILLDNQSASYPSSTGRNASGDYNGTLTLDDIFRVWATMVNTGFVPNTMIMHPFAWKIFAEENMSRLFGFQNGMAGMLWQSMQGKVGNNPSWASTPLGQNTYVSNPENLATTFTRVPSLFPQSFNIIVSPYINFTSSTSLTDIIFCDVSELGIIVVDEDVTSDEWTDPSKDIMKIKFRERYGLAVKNDGKGIGLLKNIKIAKSFDFADRVSVQYTSGQFTQPLSGDPDFMGVVT